MRSSSWCLQVESCSSSIRSQICERGWALIIDALIKHVEFIVDLQDRFVWLKSEDIIV